MPQQEIQEAVEKAANTPPENDATENDSKEEKVESKQEAPEKEEPEIDKRTLQALNLLDALEDPKKAPSVVHHLMKQLGMEPPQTKAEERKAEKGIRDLIKEELGSDYEFLSDKLGNAIEKALTVYEQKNLEKEAKREAEVAAKEYEKFITDNKVSDSEAGELMKIVDELPWSGRGSLTAYLNRILKMHRNEVSEQKAEIAKRQKQAENYDKRPKTMGVEANEDRVKKGSGTISVREAVEAAMRGETLE